MQNAKISLRNYATDATLTAITGHEGLYRFFLLPAGECELTVEALNFEPAIVRNVLIQITEVKSISTQLAVRGAKEEVVVKIPLL